MNIQMNSLSNRALFFLRESILPSLTAQQKKILAVVSIAFACLAAYCFLSRCCCFAPKSEDDESPSPDNFVAQSEVDKSLSPDNLVKKATPQSPKLQNKISSFLSNFSEGNFYTNGKTTTFIAGIEIPYHDEARKITLRNFREMTPEDQQKAIDKFQLQSDIDAIGQAAFFQKLSEVNEEVLDLVTLVDLKTNIKTSKLKYILLNDDEFKAVTLRQLDHESLVFSLRQLSHEYLDQ